MEKYPRVLNGDGCLYGQRLSEEIDEMKNNLEKIENKLDRIQWALVMASVGFATTTITIWINYFGP